MEQPKHGGVGKDLTKKSLEKQFGFGSRKTLPASRRVLEVNLYERETYHFVGRRLIELELHSGILL